MPHATHSVARVYAAALVEIGRGAGSLAAIEGDLSALGRMFDGDPWFRSFFTSPRIDRAVKWSAVEKAFKGRIGRPALGLLRVLIVKGREGILADVVDQFGRMKDLAENVVHAFLVVARPLADDLKRSVVERIERAGGKSVRLHERVDPAVLGGASIRVGDRVIDRTLRTRLAAMRKELLT